MKRGVGSFKKHFIIIVIILGITGFFYGNYLSTNESVLDTLVEYGLRVEFPARNLLIDSNVYDEVVLSPIGNIAENKIVRIYNPNLNDFDFIAGNSDECGYFFYDHTNLDEYNRTFRDGLMELTQTGNMYDAWIGLLGGNGMNEKIAIKINLNTELPLSPSEDLGSCANQDPKMPYIIVDSLISDFGVDPNDIIVYDVSRRISLLNKNYWFVSRWNSYNTGVQLIGEDDFIAGDSIVFSDSPCGSTAATQYLDSRVSEADHILNIMLMKGHGGYITGAMKNHFGTITNPPGLHETGRRCNIAFLGEHPLIDGKTRLILTDATFMASQTEKQPFDSPHYEDLFPVGTSGYRSSNSFFFAANPIVMDTVMLDFLETEENYREANSIPCGHPDGPETCQSFEYYTNIILDNAVLMDSYWNHRPTRGTIVPNPEGFSVSDFSYSEFDYVSRLVDTGAPDCSDGDTQNCINQVGVCVGSNETCIGGYWPGCTAEEYNYTGNYDGNVEIQCQDGLDNDCDGVTDDGDVDCQACTLDDVYWSDGINPINSIEEPNIVYMAVNTSACVGENVSIKIEEYDGDIFDYVESSISQVISGDFELFSWQSVWNLDGDATPDVNEYKLNISINGFGELISDYLNVNKDITTPEFYYGGAEVTPYSDSALFEWSTTNEDANYTLTVNPGNIIYFNSSYGNSRSVLVEGLDSEATYNYNLEACDFRENCVYDSSQFITELPTEINTLNFTRIEDTRIKPGSAVCQYGDSSGLRLDSSGYLLIGPDISGVLPDIESATLYLYQEIERTEVDKTVFVYPMITNLWSEGDGNGACLGTDNGATFNYTNLNQGNNPFYWFGGNIDVPGNYEAIASDTTTGLDSTIGWKAINVTNLFNGMLNGTYDPNAGFLIKYDGIGYFLTDLVSTEDSIVGLRPHINISYLVQPEIQCELTNAYWQVDSNEDTVYDGTTVTLNLNGTDCDSDQINFDIYEAELGADDFVITLNDTFNSTTWTATWFDDGFGQGDPEYYFVASLVSNSSVTYTSEDLHVLETISIGCGDKDRDGYDNCSIGDTNDDGLQKDCYDSYFSHYIDGTNECDESRLFYFFPPYSHNWISDHTLIEKDGIYHLFYHHYDLKSILHYSTIDFIDWNFEQVTINASESSTNWDDGNVWAPNIIEDSGVYYLFYTGVAHIDDGGANDYGQRIGLLTSNDLINWDRPVVNNCENVSGDGCLYDCRNPWSTHGQPGYAWNNQCRDPMIYRDDNRWLMYNTIKRSDNGLGSLDVAESIDLINWQAVTFIDEVNMDQAENAFMFTVEDVYYLLAKCWGVCDATGINYYYSDNPIENFTWMGSFDEGSYNAPEVNIFENGTYTLSASSGTGWLNIKRFEITEDHSVSIFNNIKQECSILSSDIYPGASELCNGVDEDCSLVADDTFDNEECFYLCENNGFNWTNNGGILNCCGNDVNEDSPFEVVEQIYCSDGSDNDCDGLIDTDPECPVICDDADGDGYGVCPNCNITNGCTYDGDDCDDDPGQCGANCNPGQIEVCDGYDNDCNLIDDDEGDLLCDNGLFCDGVETCGGLLECQAGTPPIMDDSVECTNDSCDEDTDSILHVPNDSLCNNGLFCDGVETCDILLDCQVGTVVDCTGNDVYDCTIDSCNETIDSCESILNETSCLINNTCYNSGDNNTDWQCEACFPEIDPYDWYGNNCQCSITPDCDGYGMPIAMCNETLGDIYNYTINPTCDNGFCIYGDLIIGDVLDNCDDTCTDTDTGLDYFNYGETYDYELCIVPDLMCPVANAFDSCEDANLLKESYCSGEDQVYDFYSCGLDTCNDGIFSCSINNELLEQYGNQYGCNDVVEDVRCAVIDSNYNCGNSLSCELTNQCINSSESLTCGGPDYTCYVSNDLWTWTDNISLINENGVDCSDTYDNNCDIEYDYDGSGDGGIHGDSGCPVEILGADIIEDSVVENSEVDMYCQINTENVNSITVSIDQGSCNSIPLWQGNIAVFSCNVGTGFGTRTITCSVDETISYKQGVDMIDTIIVTSSNCSELLTTEDCALNSDSCHWCEGCQGVRSNQNNGQGICLDNVVECDYSCDSTYCGASCTLGDIIFGGEYCFDADNLNIIEYGCNATSCILDEYLNETSQYCGDDSSNEEIYCDGNILTSNTTIINNACSNDNCTTIQNNNIIQTNCSETWEYCNPILLECSSYPTEIDCNNGIDEDDDGHTDSEDSDCPATYDLVLNSGWNFVSIPVNITNEDVTKLNASMVLTYYPEERQWKLYYKNRIDQIGNLEMARGYLIFKDANQTIEFTGTGPSGYYYPLNSTDWNLVGVTYDDLIGNIYGPGEYGVYEFIDIITYNNVSDQVLNEGKAYWVAPEGVYGPPYSPKGLVGFLAKITKMVGYVILDVNVPVRNLLILD
jgi:hypothetical protein